MAGGGGGATAVPEWLWGEGDDKIVRAWTNERGIPSPIGGGVASPRTMPTDLKQLLGILIQNDSPYGSKYNAAPSVSLSSDNIFDPDSNSGIGDQDNLLGSSYTRLDGVRTNVNDGLLNPEVIGGLDVFSGPGDVVNKLSTDIVAMITNLTDSSIGATNVDLFDPANYDLSTLVTTILANALTAATNAQSQAVSDTNTEVATLKRDAIARADAALSQTAATGASEDDADGEIIQADLAGDVTLAGAVQSSDAITDSLSPLSTAETWAKANVQTEMEAAISVLIDTTNGLETVIEAALTASQNAAYSTLVNDAVEAYEDQGLPEHVRRVNRLTGTMVDMNAVYGSPFILGMSLLERQHQRDVADFRSKLSVQMYDRAFTTYMATFDRALDLYVRELQQLIIQRLETYKLLLTERTKSYLMGFSEHVGLYAKLVASFGDMERSALGSQTALADSLLKAHMNFNSSWGSEYLQKGVGARLERLGQRDQYAKAGLVTMEDVLKLGMQTSIAIEEDLTELQTKRYIAISEREHKQIEYDRLHRLWQFDLVGKTFNYLSANAGVMTVPDKPSNLQSGIAGAAAGFSLGAQTGTPWLMAAGATIGGVAGAIQ